MAKKNKYLYDESDDAERTEISRSQKKRDSTAIQEIGEEIARLSPSQLALLPLTQDLLDAIAELQKITNMEARRRQLQFVGRLMREANHTEILSVYRELKSGRRI